MIAHCMHECVLSDLLSNGPVPPPPTGRALNSLVMEMPRLVGDHSQRSATDAVLSSLQSPVVSLLLDSQDQTVCPKDVNRKRRLSEERTSSSPENLAQNIVTLPR